jgi:hypothetical protein
MMMSEQTSNQRKIYYPPQPKNIIPGRPGCVVLYIFVIAPLGLLLTAGFFSVAAGVGYEFNIDSRWVVGAFAVVLLVQAVGLWRMRHWGRYLAAGWSVFFMVVQIAGAALLLTNSAFLETATTRTEDFVFEVLAVLLYLFLTFRSFRYFTRYGDHFKQGI